MRGSRQLLSQSNLPLHIKSSRLRPSREESNCRNYEFEYRDKAIVKTFSGYFWLSGFWGKDQNHQRYFNWIFSSSLPVLTDTKIKKIKPVITWKYEFENGHESALIEHFGSSGLPGFWVEDRNQCFSNRILRHKWEALDWYLDRRNRTSSYGEIRIWRSI